MKKRLEILEIRAMAPIRSGRGNDFANGREIIALHEKPAAPAPLHRTADDFRMTIKFEIEIQAAIRGASFRFSTDQKQVFEL